MSSTSEKHRGMVAEPAGEKRVQALPGIGETLGRRLEEKGFDKMQMQIRRPQISVRGEPGPGPGPEPERHLELTYSSPEDRGNILIQWDEGHHGERLYEA